VSDATLDDLDVAGGMIIGSLPGRGDWLGQGDHENPRKAIEDIVLEGLGHPPCLVSFSGGRDSSALLALAVGLARQNGLPPPVPISARFPGEETDEAEWQQLVLDHLGITDWVRVELTEELDLLGAAGTAFLCRHGLRYPQNVHFLEPLIQSGSGGSLLTGAGGDELFEPHRWGRASLVLARSVPARPSDALVVAVALSPGPIRARMHHRGALIVPNWLRPAGRRQLLRRIHKWGAEDRVRYDEHLEWWSRSRYLNHGQRSLELLAEDHGVRYVAPFSDDRVMRSLAATMGRGGFVSRSAAMDFLFGDLLPAAIIERESKASFQSPLVGPATRAFAKIADPTTVMSEVLVDPSALRRAWQEEHVDIRSLPALQLCWLAAQTSPIDGTTHPAH
jgi:asparagine synthase (glutamine-hydrolysing)